MSMVFFVLPVQKKPASNLLFSPPQIPVPVNNCVFGRKQQEPLPVSDQFDSLKCWKIYRGKYLQARLCTFLYFQISNVDFCPHVSTSFKYRFFETFSGQLLTFSDINGKGQSHPSGTIKLTVGGRNTFYVVLQLFF